MVPPDIDAIVHDILETCTVPDFQLYLKTLITNASLMNIRISHTALLEKAENQYRTLIISMLLILFFSNIFAQTRLGTLLRRYIFHSSFPDCV